MFRQHTIIIWHNFALEAAFMFNCLSKRYRDGIKRNFNTHLNNYLLNMAVIKMQKKSQFCFFWLSLFIFGLPIYVVDSRYFQVQILFSDHNINIPCHSAWQKECPKKKKKKYPVFSKCHQIKSKVLIMDYKLFLTLLLLWLECFSCNI